MAEQTTSDVQKLKMASIVLAIVAVIGLGGFAFQYSDKQSLTDVWAEEKAALDEQANVLDGQVKALQGQVQGLEGEVSELKAAKATLEEDVAQRKAFIEEIEATDDSLAAAKGRLVDLQSDIATHERQLQVLAKRAATSQASLQRAVQRRRGIAEEVGQSESRLQALKVAAAPFEVTVQKLQETRLEQSKAAAGLAAVNADILNNRKRLESLTVQIAASQASLQRALARHQSVVDETAQSKARLEQLKLEAEPYEATVLQLEQARLEQGRVAAQLAALSAEIGGQERRLGAVSRRLGAAQASVQKAASRRSTLDRESEKLVQKNAASELELAALRDTIAQQGARARDIDILLDRISQQLDAAGRYLGSAQDRLNE
jgi:chromosome segregation ATPase